MSFYTGPIVVGTQFTQGPYRFTVVADGDDVAGYQGRSDVWFVSELSAGKLQLVVMTEEYLRDLMGSQTEHRLRRRLAVCVASWPDCVEGGYNPSCCRFPKSCSCTVYNEHTPDIALEPEGDPRDRG